MSQKLNKLKDDKYFEKAVDLHASGNVGEAAKIYRELVNIYRNNHNLLTLLATAECQLQNIAKASELFEKSLGLNPEQSMALSNYGLLLLNQRRFGDAIALYDRAITIKPDNAEAYYNRGNALKESETI